MKKILDQGYVRFIEKWGIGDAGESEAGIIEAARQSTQGSFRGWERDEKLLKFLKSRDPEHTGPFEFAGMVVEVEAPVCVVWEWVRHRTQSYAVMSSRYGPIPNVDYLPTADRCLMVDDENRQAGAAKGADEVTRQDALAWLAELVDLYEHAERVYQHGLIAGIPKEVARLALTFGRYFRFRACANLHNWLQFLLLRMDPAAQQEIRQYANAVGELIAEHFPRTWQLFSEKAV